MNATEIVMSREWAMHSGQTFLIKPIRSLLKRLVGQSWVDPLAGRNSPAFITNDIHKNMPTDSHMEAVDFLSGFANGEFHGILLDPPYSMRQAIEMYEGHMVKKLTPVMNEAARVVKVGGMAISFGWNSNGLGKKRGFEIIELLVVAHGGQHNDTLVVVETRTS